MKSQEPLKIPPQSNVITLEEGMDRTNNWRQSAKGIYGGSETNMPHAIYIPFEDILEISKLQTLIQEYAIPPSVDAVPIYIIGVRAYLTMDHPVIPTTANPLSATSNPVDALLVPVFQTNPRPDGPGKYSHNKDFPTYDLIAPVPSATGTGAEDAASYSIYDITRPCPNLCDTSSKLF